MNLMFATKNLSDLPVEALIKWLSPLKPERIGSLPVFEVKSKQDFQFLINFYLPTCILLANPEVAAELGIPAPTDYSLTIQYLSGHELRILNTPFPQDVNWDRLEGFLDRFEEIL